MADECLGRNLTAPSISAGRDNLYMRGALPSLTTDRRKDGGVLLKYETCQSCFALYLALLASPVTQSCCQGQRRAAVTSAVGG